MTQKERIIGFLRGLIDKAQSEANFQDWQNYSELLKYWEQRLEVVTA
ncbi:hypothetical protein [uncultured Endozoicomonas sp.]|nr:hypothetical protein [uncultured Endozoicomonas sp.]